MLVRHLLSAVLLLATANAHAEQVAVLQVGQVDIRFPVADDQLRTSEELPVVFETAAAALPPSMRMVETLIARDDVKRIVAAQGLEQPYVQVQALRAAENVAISLEEWRSLQPTVAQQLGELDLESSSRALQGGMSERLSEKSGADVELTFQATGKPVVYSLDDDVIRYSMRLPLSGNINGRSVAGVTECVGAMMVLNQRLVYVFAFQVQGAGGSRMAELRETLARLVTRVRALNGPL